MSFKAMKDSIPFFPIQFNLFVKPGCFLQYSVALGLCPICREAAHCSTTTGLYPMKGDSWTHPAGRSDTFVFRGENNRKRSFHVTVRNNRLLAPVRDVFFRKESLGFSPLID